MKNKMTAALLAFFLGGFGVHRFYLGQIGLGFAYLIFCWTFIPAVIAFIDFIVLLTTGEESFNLKYNRQYLPHNPAAQPTVVINNNNNVGQFTPPVSQSAPAAQPASSIRPGNDVRLPKKDPFETAGDLKYENYDFDGAIKDFLKSLNVNSRNPQVHFKIACLYSLLEQTNNSFFHLEKAVEKGFYEMDKIQQHDHLAFLRTQPTFDNFRNNGYKSVKALEANDQINLTDAVISQIEKLAKLRDDGVIDEAEFKSQKGRLLGG